MQYQKQEFFVGVFFVLNVLPTYCGLCFTHIKNTFQPKLFAVTFLSLIDFSFFYKAMGIILAILSMEVKGITKQWTANISAPFICFI